MSQTSFYNKISQVAATELVDFLGHNQTDLVVKIMGQFIKTNILSKKSSKNLELARFSIYEFSNEPVTCSFQYQDEQYFFKSHVSGSTLEYSLEIPAEIFQLQRRSDYRVSMPLGLNYTCRVTSINGRPQVIKVEVRDLSLGGCQISLAGRLTEIQADDQLDLFLSIDRFDFPHLALTAKHVKIIESQNNTLIGASYYEPDGPFLSELQALIMYLDRIHRGKSYE